jgi:hypothetical protein
VADDRAKKPPGTALEKDSSHPDVSEVDLAEIDRVLSNFSTAIPAPSDEFGAHISELPAAPIDDPMAEVDSILEARTSYLPPVGDLSMPHPLSGAFAVPLPPLPPAYGYGYVPDRTPLGYVPDRTPLGYIPDGTPLPIPLPQYGFLPDPLGFPIVPAPGPVDPLGAPLFALPPDLAEPAPPSPPPAPPPAPSAEPTPSEATRAATADIERRKSLRQELNVRPVRAVLSMEKEQSARGRVRNMSAQGGLFIETHAPLPFKARVRADFTLPNARRMSFEGRVVRKPEDGVAIHLKANLDGVKFLHTFIEQAVAFDGPAVQDIHIFELEGEEETEQAVSEAELSQAWDKLRDNFASEEQNQAFIKLCLSGRRLDYALERYREMRRERPEDERIPKYLLQIGTIISFSAMNKAQPEKEAKKVRPAVALIFLLVVALCSLLFLLKFKLA